MSNETTLKRVADELAGRIGQMTANYEGQIAVIKVQAEEQIEALTQRCSELENDLAEAKAELDKPADD